MTFTYTKLTSSHGDEDYGIDIEYEVSRDDLLEALVELICDDYFLSSPFFKVNVRKLITACDLEDTLVEQYEDRLKEFYKEYALEV